MPVTKVIKIDEPSAIGIREFRARIAGTVGTVPSISTTIRVLLAIGNQFYTEAESTIKYESGAGS